MLDSSTICKYNNNIMSKLNSFYDYGSLSQFQSFKIKHIAASPHNNLDETALERHPTLNELESVTVNYVRESVRHIGPRAMLITLQSTPPKMQEVYGIPIGSNSS